MKVVNYVQVILYVSSVKTFDRSDLSNKFLRWFLTIFLRHGCYFSYEIKIYGRANLLRSTIYITLQIERCLRSALSSDCRSVTHDDEFLITIRTTPDTYSHALKRDLQWTDMTRNTRWGEFFPFLFMFQRSSSRVFCMRWREQRISSHSCFCRLRRHLNHL